MNVNAIFQEYYGYDSYIDELGAVLFNISVNKEEMDKPPTEPKSAILILQMVFINAEHRGVNNYLTLLQKLKKAIETPKEGQEVNSFNIRGALISIKQNEKMKEQVTKSLLDSGFQVHAMREGELILKRDL